MCELTQPFKKNLDFKHLFRFYLPLFLYIKNEIHCNPVSNDNEAFCHIHLYHLAFIQPTLVYSLSDKKVINECKTKAEILN